MESDDNIISYLPITRFIMYSHLFEIDLALIYIISINNY